MLHTSGAGAGAGSGGAGSGAGVGVQGDAWPAVEYSPAMQSVQVAAAVAEDLPAVQSAQCVDPA